MDIRIIPGAMAVLLAAALGACNDSGHRNRADINAPAANETGALPADTAGALAAKKATNAEVKQFARLMMSEHHALRQQGADLAKKLNVTPEPPADDPVTALAEKETQALQSAPKGAEFDRTYIDQEIAAHQAVLDLVTKAHDQADNAELKALIVKARPVIQKHLDQAQQIQK
jgi:putative membrane protein